MKQNFFDHLDDGWGDLIADTYKDAETTTLDYDIDEYGNKYISFGQHKKKLKDSVIVPEGVLYIDYGAFSKCKIKKVILPKSLKFVKSYAFEFAGLEGEITIPESVKHIGTHAFCLCNKLTKIYVKKDNANLRWDKDWNANCPAKIIYY